MDSKKIFLIILTTLFFLSPVYSQSRQVRKKQIKAEKVLARQKKEEDKEEKEKRKHHFNLQTKETQKRMKEKEKNAEKFNKRNDKNILNRLFDNKQRKARKKYG